MSVFDLLLEISRRALLLSVVLSAPVVIVSLVIGVLVSVFQAATQIQEPTLTFAPKLFSVLLVLAVMGPWIGSQLVTFSEMIFESLPLIAQSN